MAVRHPLAEDLRECGCWVVEAVSSAEAVSVLRDGRLNGSIVLADLDCPGGLNGFELSRRIRDRGLASRVLLAGSLERLAEKAGDLCQDAPTIRTPYSHEALLREIKSMIAHRTERWAG